MSNIVFCPFELAGSVRSFWPHQAKEPFPRLSYDTAHFKCRRAHVAAPTWRGCCVLMSASPRFFLFNSFNVLLSLEARPVINSRFKTRNLVTLKGSGLKEATLSVANCLNCGEVAGKTWPPGVRTLEGAAAASLENPWLCESNSSAIDLMRVAPSINNSSWKPAAT